ncbi:MAG: DUF2254 domain-containing protein [Actinomycetota bacterium]|nr:DUF2254 domain-containing protein [Actinomycetota bacterium]
MARREALREYASGALWVLPSVSALAALVAGYAVSHIDIGPDSPLAPLAFQGTADDARALLAGVTGTVVTVIALVLGLTVVALQLSSTQFSPRLLRNFLRDRPNQFVLSVFVATFVYAASGLFTVGVASGARTEAYPRLAVTGAIVLLFATLGMVVFFADHLAHSIQIDAIMRVVESGTLRVIQGKHGTFEEAPPAVPEWAVPLMAARSGYVQTAHPDKILPLAVTHGVCVLLRPRVGEHVVAGTTLAWIWRPSPDDPAPDSRPFQQSIHATVRIGFERTLEQDAGFGIRQLVDVACKALSPAVNDPYTAIQAIDHLSVIFCALAGRPLGSTVARDPDGRGAVIVPGRRFGEHLAIMCGLIRRYGTREPTVALALLRLLDNCAAVVRDPAVLAAIDDQAGLVLADAEREVAQPVDVAAVRTATDALQQSVRLRTGMIVGTHHDDASRSRSPQPFGQSSGDTSLDASGADGAS